jgi:hypothetical protein
VKEGNSTSKGVSPVLYAFPNQVIRSLLIKTILILTILRKESIVSIHIGTRARKLDTTVEQ